MDAGKLLFGRITSVKKTWRLAENWNRCVITRIGFSFFLLRIMLLFVTVCRGRNWMSFFISCDYCGSNFDIDLYQTLLCRRSRPMKRMAATFSENALTTSVTLRSLRIFMSRFSSKIKNSLLQPILAKWAGFNTKTMTCTIHPTPTCSGWPSRRNSNVAS